MQQSAGMLPYMRSPSGTSMRSSPIAIDPFRAGRAPVLSTFSILITLCLPTSIGETQKTAFLTEHLVKIKAPLRNVLFLTEIIWRATAGSVQSDQCRFAYGKDLLIRSLHVRDELSWYSKCRFLVETNECIMMQFLALGRSQSLYPSHRRINKHNF